MTGTEEVPEWAQELIIAVKDMKTDIKSDVDKLKQELNHVNAELNYLSNLAELAKRVSTLEMQLQSLSRRNMV